MSGPDFLGLFHTGRAMRRTRKLEHFFFDVVCQLCEHSYWQQQVPFARTAFRLALRVLWMGPKLSFRTTFWVFSVVLIFNSEPFWYVCRSNSLCRWTEYVLPPRRGWHLREFWAHVQCAGLRLLHPRGLHRSVGEWRTRGQNSAVRRLSSVRPPGSPCSAACEWQKLVTFMFRCFTVWKLSQFQPCRQSWRRRLCRSHWMQSWFFFFFFGHEEQKNWCEGTTSIRLIVNGRPI